MKGESMKLKLIFMIFLVLFLVIGNLYATGCYKDLDLDHSYQYPDDTYYCPEQEVSDIITVESDSETKLTAENNLWTYQPPDTKEFGRKVDLIAVKIGLECMKGKSDEIHILVQGNKCSYDMLDMVLKSFEYVDKVNELSVKRTGQLLEIMKTMDIKEGLLLNQMKQNVYMTEKEARKLFTEMVFKVVKELKTKGELK